MSGFIGSTIIGILMTKKTLKLCTVAAALKISINISNVSHCIICGYVAKEKNLQKRGNMSK